MVVGRKLSGTDTERTKGPDERSTDRAMEAEKLEKKQTIVDHDD